MTFLLHAGQEAKLANQAYGQSGVFNLAETGIEETLLTVKSSGACS